jgi:hypothetical protein
VKVRSLGWAQTQHDCCSYKKRRPKDRQTDTHTHTHTHTHQGDNCVRSQEEEGVYKARKRPRKEAVL